MRKLKLLMDQRNYMCIGNTHIFINFNHSNFEHLDTINPKSIGIVHVFVTAHAAINMELKLLVEKYNKAKFIDGHRYKTKVIIHLPYQVRELTYLARKILGFDEYGYKLLVERKGPKFILNPHPDYFNYEHNRLEISYNDKSLSINITYTNESDGYIDILGKGSHPVIIKFPEYPYNINDKENDPGIFETGEMRINPEMFKDKLIEGFKKNCPEGILKSFKTDDDIWDYIMEQGSWSQKDAPDSDKKKNIRGLTANALHFDDHWDKENKSGPKVAIIGSGQPPMTKQLAELIRDGKVVVVDEMSALPSIGDIKIPEPIQFPEMEFNGMPRNRAERRMAQRKGGK